MNATLTIDEPAFLNSIMAEFQKVKVPCQAAMANAFYEVVMKNFGSGDGEDRPISWIGLGKGVPGSKYAKKVGREVATLELDGELAASVWPVGEMEEYATVSTTNQYASAHQWGEGNQPPRPFFPITGPEGETVTQFTTQKCVDACEAELVRSLK